MQFIYGFDVMGAFDKGGLFTPDGKMDKPASPGRPFSDASSRFETRTKESGWPQGETMWIDDIGQAEKGRLGPPRMFLPSGGSLFLGPDRLTRPSGCRVYIWVKSGHATI